MKTNISLYFKKIIIIILSVFLIRYSFPILLAFLVSSILEKAVIKLKKALPFRRKVIAVIVFFFFIILFLLVFFLIIYMVYFELENVLSDFPGKIEAIYTTIDKFTKSFYNYFPNKSEQLSYLLQEFLQRILQSSNKILEKSFNVFASFISNLPNYFMFFFTLLISLYIFMVDRVRIMKFFSANFKDLHWKKLKKFKSKIIDLIVKYIKAELTITIFTFILLIILFLIFSIDNPITKAIYISLLDLLPMIGCGSIMIPWIIIEVINKNMVKAFVVFTIYVSVMVCRQIIEPKIFGKHFGVHPLLNLFSMYILISLFGFLGALLSPFVSYTIKVTYLYFKRKQTN